MAPARILSWILVLLWSTRASCSVDGCVSDSSGVCQDMTGLLQYKTQVDSAISGTEAEETDEATETEREEEETDEMAERGEETDEMAKSGGPDSDSDCSKISAKPACLSNGCSWSKAFNGEEIEDRFNHTSGVVHGYVCADDEEVKEELDDKESSTSASLTYEGESEAGDTSRWCRRRRANRRRRRCCWARRRRAPPAKKAKIESNGCPTGYSVSTNGKCSGDGLCCKAGWSGSCGESCAKSSCTSLKGKWVPLDYSSNPYTCEMPAPKPQPNGCPSGYSVSTNGKCSGSGLCCKAGWSGSCGESCAKSSCTSSNGKWVPLDYSSNPYTCEMPALAPPPSETCDETLKGKNNAGYRGCQTRTKSGRTCQKWTAQSPQKHRISEARYPGKGVGDHNYCRNPDNEPDIWCYTTDAKKRWEFCDPLKTPAPPTSPPPTPAPTPAPESTFDIVDTNDDNSIDRKEFQKALDAGNGKISASTTPTAPSATTGSPSKPSTAGLTQAQKDDIVAKHNELRRGLGASDMTLMAWSDVIAEAASQWVSGCPSGHSQNRNNVGENIAWKWSSNFKLTSTTDFTASIQSWYDEISDAGTYKAGGKFSGFGVCSGVCGHYTQVAWAAANQIGCGVKLCPHSSGMPGYELVCQYGSSVPGGHGGNMMGSTLFTKGAPCSSCPAGFAKCTNKLCSVGA